MSPDDPPEGSRPAGRRTILVFHKAQNSFSFGATNYSPPRLRTVLGNLRREGYVFQSVGETIHQNDPKTLAVTFDDGYAHLRDILPDLMQEFGLRPTVFLPTAYLGCNNSWDYSSVFRSTPHLDAAGIRELASLGVEFGAHGHRHVDLTRLKEADLRDELERSRKTLEDILGQPVTSLSYPFGRVNHSVATAAADAGYRYGLTMSFPSASDSDLTLGRIPVYGFDTWFSLRQKIEPGPLYALERLKCGVANRLSAGTSLWRYLSGR